MKKYHINVWVSVYADSEDVAKSEVRRCLNTGQGHIHNYELADVREDSLNSPVRTPFPCGCEIYQTCEKCR